MCWKSTSLLEFGQYARPLVQKSTYLVGMHGGVRSWCQVHKAGCTCFGWNKRRDCKRLWCKLRPLNIRLKWTLTLGIRRIKSKAILEILGDWWTVTVQSFNTQLNFMKLDRQFVCRCSESHTTENNCLQSKFLLTPKVPCNFLNCKRCGDFGLGRVICLSKKKRNYSPKKSSYDWVLIPLQF